MKLRKLIAGALALVTAVGLTACGGNSGGTTAGSAAGEKVSFTIFNSKNEIQENLENAAKQYADAGKMVPNYDYDPDDHYSKLGAEMQRYLAGQCTREQLADAIENYWANVTPVEH